MLCTRARRGRTALTTATLDADEEEEQDGEDTEDAEGDEEGGAASGSEAASESLGSSEASGSGGEGSGSPGTSLGAGTRDLPAVPQLPGGRRARAARPALRQRAVPALEICIVDDEEGAALRILTAAPSERREVHNTYGELGTGTC